MALPDISQQANYQDGNSVFDSVFILEKLDYDFTKSGPITISELNVVGISTFNSDVTFSGGHYMGHLPIVHLPIPHCAPPHFMVVTLFSRAETCRL